MAAKSLLELHLCLQPINLDTLDLQDQASPSAKDHSRQPTHPSIGFGSAAPHQNQQLRDAKQDAIQEHLTSPQFSHSHDHSGFADEPELYDDQDDDASEGSRLQYREVNGHLGDDSGLDDSDIGDQGDDDALDDDLMDKISSSPSIDDGNYPFSIIWPSRMDPVGSSVLPQDEPEPLSVASVSALEQSLVQPFRAGTSFFHGHSLDKYLAYTEEDRLNMSLSPHERATVAHLSQYQEAEETDDFAGLGTDNIDRFLIPLDDPLLGVDDESDLSDDLPGDNIDSDHWNDEDDMDSQGLNSSSDEDSGHHLFTTDSRFIDSGWGGECLREVEDIDFEFVYALHTFVATVEGQANATKGDTMVLLDDSNSYWWLVRVVKDGSIGKMVWETSVACCAKFQQRISASGAHRDSHRKIGSSQQA
jgi:hypothetical protein